MNLSSYEINKIINNEIIDFIKGEHCDYNYMLFIHKLNNCHTLNKRLKSGNREVFLICCYDDLNKVKEILSKRKKIKYILFHSVYKEHEKKIQRIINNLPDNIEYINFMYGCGNLKFYYLPNKLQKTFNKKYAT